MAADVELQQHQFGSSSTSTRSNSVVGAMGLEQEIPSPTSSSSYDRSRSYSEVLFLVRHAFFDNNYFDKKQDKLEFFVPSNTFVNFFSKKINLGYFQDFEQELASILRRSPNDLGDCGAGGGGGRRDSVSSSASSATTPTGGGGGLDSVKGKVGGACVDYDADGTLQCSRITYQVLVSQFGKTLVIKKCATRKQSFHGPAAWIIRSNNFLTYPWATM